MNRKPAGPRHTAIEIHALLEAAGATELAARFGLSDALLADPDATVPISLLHDLMESAIAASGDEYFGLRFGTGITRTEFTHRLGALGLLILSSPSVEVALDHTVRYQRMFNEGDRYQIEKFGHETHIRFLPYGPARIAQIHAAEKSVAQILSIFELIEAAIEPRAIHLAHGERAGSEEASRLFRIAPVYDAEFTAIIVATKDLSRPFRGADPDVFSFLDRDLRKRVGTPEVQYGCSPFTIRAQEEIAIGLQTGQYSLDWVADQLDCSKRTLQRRLVADGTSVSALVIEIRQARSKVLLATDMSIGDIAFLLGYSSSAPFVRAFQRWFGKSPSEWRESSLN